MGIQVVERVWDKLSFRIQFCYGSGYLIVRWGTDSPAKYNQNKAPCSFFHQGKHLYSIHSLYSMTFNFRLMQGVARLTMNPTLLHITPLNGVSQYISPTQNPQTTLKLTV